MIAPTRGGFQPPKMPRQSPFVEGFMSACLAGLFAGASMGLLRLVGIGPLASMIASGIACAIFEATLLLFSVRPIDPQESQEGRAGFWPMFWGFLAGDVIAFAVGYLRMF